MPRTSLSAAAPLALALTLGPGLAGEALALDPGAEEYMNSCAVCHGESGKGDGPLAALMTIEVPDLTQIAARNDGRFPVQKITRIIDGRSEIAGHGYPMPVWGRRFEAQADETYGPFAAEGVVRGRILELTYYLHSIQE
jgi:mono/diheme cytochrome c family protein